MNVDLSIRNFRTFGKDGIEVGLKPITVLTGCNSSGKSTITKALLLLRDYLNDVHTDYVKSGDVLFGRHNIDFAKLNLGTFQNVLNRNSDGKSFTLGYSVCPDCSIVPFSVEFSFSERDDDFMKKGWLSNMTIKTWEGKTFLDADFQGDQIRFNHLYLNSIIVPFVRFVRFFSYFRINSQINELEGRRDFEYVDENEIAPFREKLEEILLTLAPCYEQDLKAENYLDEHFKNKYPKLLDQDIYDLLQAVTEDNILFSFPVFKQLKDKTKAEQLEILEGATCSQNIFNIDFDLMKSSTIESFKSSDYESFLDFFRSLEDEELNELVRESNHDLMFQNSRRDFLDYLDLRLSLSFNDSGSVQWVCANDHGFDKAYIFLSAWQWASPDEDDFVEMLIADTGNVYHSRHKTFWALKQYAVLLVESLLDTKYLGDIQYVGNFHSDVMRMYSFDNKYSSMVRILTRYLSLKKMLEEKSNDSSHRWFLEKDKDFRPFHVGDFINKWIRKLGIGRNLNIIPDEDNLGAKIFIRKDAKSRKGYPIADEGAGIAQLITFLLYIETEILQNEIQRYENYLLSNGEKKKEGRIVTLLLEEPEIGLHPSLQSSLTDILLDAYKSYNIHFVIETHSEYLIRRSQAIVANYKSKKEFQDNPFRVYYINPETGLYDLEYTETGRFNQPFGSGFFDEASRSSLEILKRERRGK